MKIVIAPDSFKESLDAHQVASCIERGFADVFPHAEFVKMPLADGGEGTVDVLLEALNGKKQGLQTTDQSVANVRLIGLHLYNRLMAKA